MTSDGHNSAREFGELFGRFEYALKRSDHLAKGKAHAEADWRSYAKALGPDFFKEVVSSGVAPTLINDPPRKLMREGLTWSRSDSGPLKDVEDLFVHGVCRVRNSLQHGEKFVGGHGQWERDSRLVSEALQVLRIALAQRPLEPPPSSNES